MFGHLSLKPQVGHKVLGSVLVGKLQETKGSLTEGQALPDVSTMEDYQWAAAFEESRGPVASGGHL